MSRVATCEDKQPCETYLGQLVSLVTSLFVDDSQVMLHEVSASVFVVLCIVCAEVSPLSLCCASIIYNQGILTHTSEKRLDKVRM